MRPDAGCGQAGNHPEARAKVMLALSQGDTGRDSPEVGDGNVFSAAASEVRASGLLTGIGGIAGRARVCECVSVRS